MRNAIAGDGIRQRLSNVLLPDQIGELLGPVTPGDHGIVTRFAIGISRLGFRFRHVERVSKRAAVGYG